jgi:hypothetical protein
MKGRVSGRRRVGSRCYGAFIGALLLIVVSIFQSVAAQGQVSHGSSTNQQSAQAPKKNETPSITANPTLPSCPPAGIPNFQPPPQNTGHHTITLSWQRSASSGKPDSQAVGYCLYRSKEQNAAKQNATCSHCEQINSMPLGDTACVDDLVEDGATYYYVVAAIDGKGRISYPSNEILAHVPSTKKSTNPADSYPLCRGPKGLKEADPH